MIGDQTMWLDLWRIRNTVSFVIYNGMPFQNLPLEDRCLYHHVSRQGAWDVFVHSDGQIFKSGGMIFTEIFSNI